MKTDGAYFRSTTNRNANRLHGTSYVLKHALLRS